MDVAVGGGLGGLERGCDHFLVALSKRLEVVVGGLVGFDRHKARWTFGVVGVVGVVTVL